MPSESSTSVMRSWIAEISEGTPPLVKCSFRAIESLRMETSTWRCSRPTVEYQSEKASRKAETPNTTAKINAKRMPAERINGRDRRFRGCGAATEAADGANRHHPAPDR